MANELWQAEKCNRKDNWDNACCNQLNWQNAFYVTIVTVAVDTLGVIDGNDTLCLVASRQEIYNDEASDCHDENSPEYGRINGQREPIENI